MDEHLLGGMKDAKDDKKAEHEAEHEDTTVEGKAMSASKRCAISCCKISTVVFIVLFVLMWILQAWQYMIGSWGCSASSVGNYVPNNKADGISCPNCDDYNKVSDTSVTCVNSSKRSTCMKGGQNVNWLPRYTRLDFEKNDWKWYQPYKYMGMTKVELYASNDNQNEIGTTLGYFWKTWGPIFDTWVFTMNPDNKPILFSRRKMLSLGNSHIFEDCAGITQTTQISEGTSYFANRFHQLTGSVTGYAFNIYYGGNQVGTMEETASSANRPGLTFSLLNEEESDKMAMGNKLNDQHGDASWFIDSEVTSPLPYYVPIFQTVIYAQYSANAQAAAAEKSTPQPKNFLVEKEAAPKDEISTAVEAAEAPWDGHARDDAPAEKEGVAPAAEED